MQALVDAYDAAVETILVDPRIAADRASPEVGAFLSLFPPDSTFASGTLDFWVGEGAEGRFYRPGPRGRMYESTVQSVSVDSIDQATFTVCTRKSILIVDASGNEVSSEGGVQAGSVVAVRNEGVWRLRDLTRIQAESCPDPRGDS